LAGFAIVMLFGDRLSEQEVLEAKAADRESLLDRLLRDFRKAFPDLTFEFQLDFLGINALAMRLQDSRNVTIYGGLALHPKLKADSLTFILLHESGHHLAEGCRLVRDPSLACECAADYWALTKGADQLRQRSGRHLDIAAAVAELSAVMSTGQALKSSYAKGRSSSICWTQTWILRSRALHERTPPPTDIGCCFSYA
jgi:hypothetical protein